MSIEEGSWADTLNITVVSSTALPAAWPAQITQKTLQAVLFWRMSHFGTSASGLLMSLAPHSLVQGLTLELASPNSPEDPAGCPLLAHVPLWYALPPVSMAILLVSLALLGPVQILTPEPASPEYPEDALVCPPSGVGALLCSEIL